MAHRAVAHRELVVGDALHEVPVVGDHQEGARPGVEEVLDRGEHVGVHVVGRLVEDEDVGLVEEDEEELEAALLAAGQILDP